MRHACYWVSRPQEHIWSKKSLLESLGDMELPRCIKVHQGAWDHRLNQGTEATPEIASWLEWSRLQPTAANSCTRLQCAFPHRTINHAEFYCSCMDYLIVCHCSKTHDLEDSRIFSEDEHSDAQCPSTDAWQVGAMRNTASVMPLDMSILIWRIHVAKMC
jgi:hypothetical protein